MLANHRDRRHLGLHPWVTTPYVGWVCCWFSPLLREVFIWVLLFFPQKPTLLNSNSTRNPVDKEPVSGCATSKLLFIYFFFIYLFYFVSWPGVRLYFSTAAVRAPLERPSKLQLVHARLPPGFAPSATSQRPSQVHAAFYRQGTW